MKDEHQQPKEYIITEEERKWCYHKFYELDHEAGVEFHRISDKIRSRPHPAPCNYPDMISCPNAILCSECNVNDIASADRARKAREDVLDKIMWYMVNHGVEKRPEGYYVISGTFSLSGFIKHIESLRSTQQQAGEP